MLPGLEEPITWGGQLACPLVFKENKMIIKNVLQRPIKVLLNGKTYDFPVKSSLEVDDKEGEFILSIQPSLVKEEKKEEPIVESVVINAEPVEIEEPKAKKNVVKNKKSRK